MNKDILDFVTFCVGAVALNLNMPRTDVFARLKKSGIMDEYIIPCYDSLHTFSRSYVVNDITEYMKEKGVLV